MSQYGDKKSLPSAASYPQLSYSSIKLILEEVKERLSLFVRDS
jgi:hypothetical protein